MEAKYGVKHTTVQQLLSKLQGKEIAMPDIQRPFVWDGARVRELIDSLYNGFPVGYIVTSMAQNVKLKDGGVSVGSQTIIIDGQQRITALATALLSWEIVEKDYNKRVIRIAFNPKTKEFKVADATTSRDKQWIPDISVFFAGQANIDKWFNTYREDNPEISMTDGMAIIASFNAIANREIGLVELQSNISMDDITTIFNRINSQAVQLKEADFVMSKIAANEIYAGSMLRKTIDHFCELVVKPEMFDCIKRNDREFAASPYLNKIAWLKHENDDVYNPSYEDMLRVVLVHKFNRGRMSQLVQLLSGRNFTTQEYEQEIIEDTFARMQSGVDSFINETNFKNFVMILNSAGFIKGSMVRSTNAINFSYSLYLYLRSIGLQSDKVQNIVRRWFVMSLLTARYSYSPESRMEKDIRQIAERGVEDYLSEIERVELSETFWNDGLVLTLKTSSVTNSSFNVFLAAQCKNNVCGFLSTNFTVRNMIEQKGDIHHIFPKAYLQDKGLLPSQYNQVANYAYVQSEINIKIGKRSPNDYFSYVVNEQCRGKELRFGGIVCYDVLKENMEDNCIPDELWLMDIDRYDEFLYKRRELMASSIRKYYESL